ncbi:protein lifeguard 4 [Eurytemora carolleeae]|uniref:protein lifeguard 4 n=1 Tax=Eurytemora carolleeae TaxID=1294199 RepID=UPI000C773A42|nr:protein lifeguard 4 [Eurytemora carolleeae]|eukprot:XP_023338547.1 protein lifeguard 4-like [Eurytemora affinis]
MAASASVPLMEDIEGGSDLEEGGGLKNDFAFNNNVAGASKLIRLGFMRKVYGLLSIQLSITTLIGAALILTPGVKEMVQANSWMLFPAFFLSFGLLIALQVKRKVHPTNLILLAAFTVVEAYTVGVLVTFFDKLVVVQAFFLTAAVVVGLTIFTFQTKRDFSNMGAALFTGLIVLIMGGFLQVLVGGEITETALAVGGALLFSLFIIYDTQMIMTRVCPEEYIMATIQLYLDIINLFIEILKILEKVNRK